MIDFRNWHETSAHRLYVYRERAKKNKVGNNDWRQHIYKRGHMFVPATITRGTDEHAGKWFTERKDQIGAYLGDAHEINEHIRHRGYYTDDLCDETMIGGVAQLRTSKGTYYIPVTHHSDWDGTTHYMRDAELVLRGATEAEHDAARRAAASHADQNAEREAEEAREFYAKDRAEQDIEAARERIHECNREALALLREIKHNKPSPIICKALRAHLGRMLADRKREFKTIAARTADFWTAVQS